MDNIEIMNKINNIFLEGIINDTLDIYEATQLINDSIEVFNPKYICEAEGFYMTDEEKAAKERAKKTKKKIIIAIAIGTALLTTITGLIIFYKKKGNSKSVKELEKTKTEVKNNINELNKIKNKPSISKEEESKANNIINNINNTKSQVKKAEKSYNDDIIKFSKYVDQSSDEYKKLKKSYDNKEISQAIYAHELSKLAVKHQKELTIKERNKINDIYKREHDERNKELEKYLTDVENEFNKRTEDDINKLKELRRKIDNNNIL